MKKASLATLILVLLVASSAFAQHITADLVGTIQDPSGGVIPGATITVKNVDTGQTRTGTTDASGGYTISLLPVGNYEVSASKAGFKEAVVSGVTLEVDQVARVDLTMQVGEQTQVVNVSGQAEALTHTDTPTVGQLISNTQLEELPIEKGQFMVLIDLDAGSTKPGGFLDSVFNWFGGHANSYGSPADASRFTLDGVDMKGVAYSRIDMRPSPDAIQEYNVESVDTTAQFGGNSGMQVNLVSKSGTNTLHGDVYEDFRNDKLDSRNFFDTTKPAYRYNLFGGSVGGPIQKNKTFFFANYEGKREIDPTVRLVSTPTMAMRNGDFSSLLPTTQIFDPSTYNSGTGQRTAFAGNKIPAGELDPVAHNVLFGAGNLPSLYPLPNLPGNLNNLLATVPSQWYDNQFSGRVNHSFSSADSVFFRYSYLSQPMIQRFNRYLHGLPNFSDDWDTYDHNIVLGWTHLFGSATVENLRLGYMRMTQLIHPPDIGTNYDGTFGITGTSQEFLYAPDISITGYGRTGPLVNDPNNRRENTFNIVDSVNYTRGNHTFAYGGELRQRGQNGGAQFICPNGAFSFTTTFTAQPGVAGTGNALASFDLGLPASASTARQNGFGNVKQDTFALYIGDTWKATSRLTVSAGLRWEHYGPWTESHGDISEFDSVTGNVLPLNGTSKFGKDVVPPYWKDFEPHVGVAYRPFGNNKTVIRAGYSLGFMIPFDSFAIAPGLKNNPPQVQPLNFVSTTPQPNLTLADAFPTGVKIASLAVTGFQQNWQDGYNEQWSFTVERQLAPDTVLEVGYVGNRGVHLRETGLGFDYAPPGPGAVQARRPYTQYTGITMWTDGGSSDYAGLRVNLKKRWSHGLSAGFSFVWAHAEDCGGDAYYADIVDNVRRNQFDCAEEWGNSINQIPHTAVGNFIWALPWYRDQSGAAARVLGGWRVSAIITHNTGGPADETYAADNSNTGSFLDRPDRIGNPNSGAMHTQTNWYNTTAFVSPVQYTRGNAGRNLIQGPPYNDIDFSINKDLYAKESKRLQLRVGFFNLLNNVNFDLPSTTFGTPATIGYADDARQVEFAMRFAF